MGEVVVLAAVAVLAVAVVALLRPPPPPPLPTLEVPMATTDVDDRQARLDELTARVHAPGDGDAAPPAAPAATAAAAPTTDVVAPTIGSPHGNPCLVCGATEIRTDGRSDRAVDYWQRWSSTGSRPGYLCAHCRDTPRLRWTSDGSLPGGTHNTDLLVAGWLGVPVVERLAERIRWRPVGHPERADQATYLARYEAVKDRPASTREYLDQRLAAQREAVAS